MPPSRQKGKSYTGNGTHYITLSILAVFPIGLTHMDDIMTSRHRRRPVIIIGEENIWGKFILRPDSEMLKNI